MALELEDRIRDMPDFPQPGILFKDITPLLQDPVYLREAIDRLAERCRAVKPEVVAAVDRAGSFSARRWPTRWALALCRCAKWVSCPRPRSVTSTPWSMARPPWRCTKTPSCPASAY